MKKDETISDLDILGLVTDIVTAYAGNNTLEPQELPAVIRSVHDSLSALTSVNSEHDNPVPAVAIKNSYTHDYIICLEDGKKLTMLKRYLRTRYDMTPEEYREKWGLPASYPMVAPSYAARRSELAKKSGLGTSKARTK